MIARSIKTQRLMLRPMTADDLPDVVRIAGDYEVSKWLVPVPYPYTQSDAEDFLTMDKAGKLGTLWIIDLSNALVGAVSIGKELGYWLDPAAWGQGIMTEAGTAAVAAHFDGSDDQRILSSHFIENHGSRRVLEKIGFVDTGAHLHFSTARHSEVPGRSMALTRARWLDVAHD